MEATRPPGRQSRIIDGRKVAFDEEGFFDDFEQWSMKCCEILARESGILHLEERHRRVIHFLRQFYEYNARAPLNKELRQGTGLSLLEMERLFPQGIKNGARRLAGLPNPKTCN